LPGSHSGSRLVRWRFRGLRIDIVSRTLRISPRCRHCRGSTTAAASRSSSVSITRQPDYYQTRPGVGGPAPPLQQRRDIRHSSAAATVWVVGSGSGGSTKTVRHRLLVVAERTLTFPHLHSASMLSCCRARHLAHVFPQPSVHSASSRSSYDRVVSRLLRDSFAVLPFSSSSHSRRNLPGRIRLLFSIRLLANADCGRPPSGSASTW